MVSRHTLSTGFGQDFVRLYSQQVYGIPPEQVVGSALAVKYDYFKDGKPILIKEPKLIGERNENDLLEVPHRSFAIASRFPDSTVLKGSSFFNSGFCSASTGTRSRQYII